MHDIATRLARGIETREQFFAATTMIAVGDPPRFSGSAFFVAEVDAGRPIVDIANAANTYLVTARHVVADAIHKSSPLIARVPCFGGGVQDVMLPLTDWHHREEVSVIALPGLRYEYREAGPAFTVISKSQFFGAGWGFGGSFEVADSVRMFGLWSAHIETPQIIIRTGTFALATIDPVSFNSGSMRVYLVDGIVTRGMSGGPACISRGGGLAQNALIGLIFGFFPSDDHELDGSTVGLTESDEQRLRRQLRTEVQRLNTGLAVVVPVHEIAEALVEVGWGR